MHNALSAPLPLASPVARARETLSIMVRLGFVLGALFAVKTVAQQQPTVPSPSLESQAVAGVGAVPNEVGRAGWDFYDDLRVQEDQGRVYRVRETVYAPAPRPTASSAPTTAVVSVVAPPAPHIAATLKPLFNYFVHHPVRATIKVAPYVGRFCWTSLKHAVRAAYNLGRFTVATLYAFFATPTLVILRPFFIAYQLAASLRAVWLTALGAILAGSGIGAVAGLVTGSQTRTLIDRWSGRGGAKSHESGLGGASGPARAKLERIDVKGKGRAMDGVGLGTEPYIPLDGAGVPEPTWYDVDATPRAARTGDWKRFAAPRDDDALEDDSEEDYDDDTVRAPESRAGSGSSGTGSKGSSSSSGSSSGTAASLATRAGGAQSARRG